MSGAAAFAHELRLAGLARRCERRRPEKTPPHKIVSKNLESWFEWRGRAERRVPGHVEKELRGYLECGIRPTPSAQGFCDGVRPVPGSSPAG